MSKQEHYFLYFDGCSKGNPGVAGCGAVLYDNFQNEIWSGSLFVDKQATNNVAEYKGLIFGLQNVIKLNETNKQNNPYNTDELIKTITVNGDSLLVIQQMKGVWKVKNDRMIELYKEAKNLEWEFNKIVYNHVPREKNKRADELSNIAVVNYI